MEQPKIEEAIIYDDKDSNDHFLIISFDNGTIWEIPLNGEGHEHVFSDPTHNE